MSKQRKPHNYACLSAYTAFPGRGVSFFALPGLPIYAFLLSGTEFGNVAHCALVSTGHKLNPPTTTGHDSLN
jgi:hypothetical protein